MIMVKTFAVVVAASAFMSCHHHTVGTTSHAHTSATRADVTSETFLTDAEKKAGWQLLFDGSTTKGWHNYGGAPVGSAWKVKDGSLYLDASNKVNNRIVDGGNLVTDEAFENFHLKLEWKIENCGNSGIIFYVKEDPVAYKNPYETGPEMQILDNACHPDAKIHKHRAGDLYDLIACQKETVKPALEWNLAEIKSVNGKVDFYLNGEHVVSTTFWDSNWKKMLENSKFKQWPDFGTFKKGHIVLQDHDNQVWFRNIKIKRL
jgi:hypothetical protein